MEISKINKRFCALLAAAMLSGCSNGAADISDDYSPWTDSVFSSETSSDENAQSNTAPNDSTSSDSIPQDSSEDEVSAAESTPDDAYPDSSNTKLDASGLYDTSMISAAYLSGDASQLDDMQAEILAAASEIIDKCITEEMTPVDKELAIHDYICRYLQYDKSALDIFHSVQPHSDDPYGMLVLGRGICSGYATSFKLLMDMLEIECLTVHATANRGDEHAWNMVRLDGEWYAVDVTWDDLDEGDPDVLVNHDFFNCTDGTMLTHSHEWDLSKIPHANGMKYSYTALFTKEVGSKEEIIEAFKATLDMGHDTVLLKGVGEYADLSANRLGREAVGCLDALSAEGYIDSTSGGITTVKIISAEQLLYKF